ncbi:MAG: MFS transporter [Ignavibacteriales bacterium]|nr:MFS transporter [Ignavibacteriales bacterium]MBI3788137.1 MFS transporter [Ignavibacteriales bacterium]
MKEIFSDSKHHAESSAFSIRNYLGLNRNVTVLAVSVFGLALGEELWQAYLPKYLSMLGASGVVVGLFSSYKDFLDGLYQYPGGWINDKFGRKNALMLFTVIAMSGYAVFALAQQWGFLFLGLTLVMAWKSGAFPATFAVIGDAMPHGKRAIAFSVQSILLRFPRVIGAPLGGLLIVGLGMNFGIRIAFGITLVLGALVLFTQWHGYRERPASENSYSETSAMEIFRQLPKALKRLLLAELLVRIGEGIAAAFIILYVINILNFSVATYGTLYAIQHAVAISSYIPSGKLADMTGRKPLIALTFLFFALFPLAVHLSTSLGALTVAFIIGGLKEMGEPARKSFIVDMADPNQRGRAVGIYYTIRNLLIVPAGAIGGILWEQSPHLPLQVAFVVGICGLVVYLFSSSNNAKPRTI